MIQNIKMKVSINILIYVNLKDLIKELLNFYLMKEEKINILMKLLIVAHLLKYIKNLINKNINKNNI